MSRNFSTLFNAVRSFSTSSVARDVRVAQAKLPQALHHIMKESVIAEETPTLMPMEQEVLEKRCREFWKFLHDEAKHDGDAKSLVEAITNFRKGDIDPAAPQIMRIENLMPKLSRNDTKRDIMAYDISCDGPPRSNMKKILVEQSPNLDFLQIIFRLCGLKTPSHGGLPGNFSPFLVIDDIQSQKPHCDGSAEVDGEVPQALTIKANSLMALKSDKLSPVSTRFIDAADIAQKLSAKSLEILQRPNFVGLSRSATKTHPILKLNEHGVWTILYPQGQVMSRNQAPENDEAMEEFREVLQEMQRRKSYSLVLSASSEGKPDEVVIFNNTRLVHWRDCANVRDIGIRQVVSLIGQGKFGVPQI